MTITARDAAIAAAALVATLVMLAAGGFGTASPDARGLDALGAALALLGCGALVLRRAAPLAVYAVAALTSIALLALGFQLDAPFAALVAVHALAARYAAHPDRSRRWTAAGAVAAFLPLVGAALGLQGLDVGALIAPELVGWAAVFAGVWVAGDRAQLRAAREAELRQRAERAEREAVRERRLAAAEERTRIARELHDSAGHAINVILVQAGAARLLHEQAPERSRAALTTIEQVARETIGEIDRLVHALREDGEGAPAPPADPAALEELVARHRDGGLHVVADVRGPREPVPRSVAWAAYRIVQEALTNAARHGRGRAELAVDFGDDRLEITVRNPAGEAREDRGGHGIVGMRERATLLGGTLEAGRVDGTFRLRAELPYGEAAA